MHDELNWAGGWLSKDFQRVLFSWGELGASLLGFSSRQHRCVDDYKGNVHADLIKTNSGSMKCYQANSSFMSIQQPVYMVCRYIILPVKPSSCCTCQARTLWANELCSMSMGVSTTVITTELQSSVVPTARTSSRSNAPWEQGTTEVGFDGIWTE